MEIGHAFIKKIEERIKDRKQLSTLIASILKKSPSSVYRRIKGEIPFTLEEAVVLAKQFGISFDRLIEEYAIITPQVNSTDEHEVELSFSAMADYWEMIHEITENSSNTEHGTLSPTIPYSFLCLLPHWVYFYNYYWAYRNGYTEHSFEEFNNTYHSKINKEENDYRSHVLAQPKYTYIVTSREMLKSLVSDFSYFKDLGRISDELNRRMKDELISFINLFEEMAKSGKIYSTGNTFELYISDNISYENLEYMWSDNLSIAIQSIFAIEANVYSHKKAERIKKWSESMKRLSTKISDSSYIERNAFFDIQRNYIESI